MPPGALNFWRRLTVAGCPPQILHGSTVFITPPFALGGGGVIEANRLRLLSR
jgi:hypothetical protein